MSLSRRAARVTRAARTAAARAQAAARSATDAAAAGAEAGEGAAPVPGEQPGEVLLAVCTGHRCAALQRLAGHDDPVGWVREAVRSSGSGVLVSAGCLGACAHGPVAAVALQPRDGRPSGPTVWLSGLDDAARAGAVRQWVAAGGRLPDGLAGAVLRVGPPLLLRSVPQPPPPGSE